jgi:geranylgeranyl reductase family protein
MSAEKPHSFDVAIVGAGPAGGSAALALAAAGYSVLILERDVLPRYKTCGGGVLSRAFRRLPENAGNVVERSFNSVALNFLGTGLGFIATRSQPMVYMTMRADLDALIVREAQRVGATLMESCTVRHVETLDQGVEIISDQGRHRAQFVIAADGVHSATARAAGWRTSPALAPALEYEIEVPAADFARFGEMPRFDFNAIDAGYGWVFPKRRHLSVGVLCTQRVCADLPDKLQGYLHQIGITQIDQCERHGYLIPLAPRPGPLARGRVLLAGDAAGLVDPVTAEGISHAIVSGQIAAAALTEGRMDPAKVAPLYTRLLEKHILGELRAARYLARILYRHPRVRNGAFRLNGQRLCDFAVKVIMGEATYGHALKRPANYFKLLGW